MTGTIVIALDGSEGADRAFTVTRRVVGLEAGASVVIAHARTRAIEPSIDDRLTARAEELRSHGIDARVDTRTALMGEEAQVIADVAHEAHASMVVIASRGRGPFKGALMGSTTQRLLPLATCPVLVVPPAFVAGG
jgi:nucleotide-binding universal stress UspA family protein